MASGASGASPRGLDRVLPRSLFGRLLLVLGAGLLVAQLLSAWINAAERDRLVSGHFGMQSAQRVADVVQLLDGLGDAERQRLLSLFRAPPLVLTLGTAPRLPEAAAQGWRMQLFAQRLRVALGDARPVRLFEREADAATPARAMAEGAPARPWRGPPPGAEAEALARMREHMAGGMGRGMMGVGPGGLGMQIEVQLRDGSWAAFDTELPEAPQALPLRLALSLLVLLATVLGLSFVAVRWVVRPLQQLTRAAQALGEDLNRPPLPEAGPREVQHAARAFNTMQSRLSAFINDRARVLTALSHDLKTPLTRMRLRADLLDDDEQRLRFEGDLKEMEAMVNDTLAFMRDSGTHPPHQPVDMMALLRALQADNQALGRTLVIDGEVTRPCQGVAALLKRALANLVDNAFLYGGQARVKVEHTPGLLTLRIQDAGPGIAPDELERVFDPFYRLEASRSRATGGSGLGLGIARNTVRAHGGELVLRNLPQGGLEAVVTLPMARP